LVAQDITPADAEDQGHGPHGHLPAVTLGALGVVYGDIGTSPLYAMRESLHAAAHDGLVREDVIGVISLLIWTLILIVTVKYVIFVLRADNRGEGGTLSLVALLQQGLGARPVWLLALGMLGVSLFFGDAMITPAMSVLSAVEGMALVTPAFEAWVVPVTLAIIIALFLVQRWGTAAVSIMFGPIMLLWFATMAVFGLMHIGDDWSILTALNPLHALGFIATNGFASLIVLGSVFLAVTGGEALYADMGHFGAKPIRVAWYGVVFPALTLSYLGQGALVLAHPETMENPFFLLAPEGLLLPLVLLATAATVIASQAVISGAFSMFKQAVRMGLLPRFEIVHTSETQEGQIYLPRVNRILLVGVVVLVLIFGSSTNLASAYGIAVSGDMVITSILAAVLFLRVWRWSLPAVAALMLPLLALELVFLAANGMKLLSGGYVPVLIAAVACLLMWTWVRGAAHVSAEAREEPVELPALCRELDAQGKARIVEGTAVFLTSETGIAPDALLQNLKHNQVLHAQNLIVTVTLDTRPRVPEAERAQITPIGPRFTGVRLAFGYMEEPNVSRALGRARKQGLKFDIMQTSFFLNRRSFRSNPHRGLPRWQEPIFTSMARGAADATSFYRLPTERVIEIGQQITI
jgi:KUP system potassium uptake protein